MENQKKISEKDSIIASKLLLCEAYRKNQKIVEKNKDEINFLFELNSDPSIIRMGLSRLKIFSEMKKNNN